MNVRLVVSIFICIVVITAGIFFFATYEGAQVKEKVPTQATTTPAVTLKDSFKKGIHTITGTVTVPTPCTEIDANAAVDSAQNPPVIQVNITTTASEGICLLRAENEAFTLKVTAPESATVVTSVDGILVTK